MQDELKQIKKIYGEEMAHLCRSLFPDVLEHEGKLLKILKDNLAPTRSFAKDIIEKNLQSSFRNWVYSLLNDEDIKLIETDKKPFELMAEAGYLLYECSSEEEIQSFRHYYSRSDGSETPVYEPGTHPKPHRGEELCTFGGDRLDRCYVFFAVRHDADELKRSDFTDPRREDKYGTSVISIQFSKDYPNVLSIKNRYNHTVNNPDATFGNNLENIIPGLTRSFEKEYELNIEQSTNEEGYFLQSDLQYVRANDGKYYRYNIEMDNIYYCENNIIIKGGNVIRTYADNKERYILAEQCVIDLKEKKVFFPCPSFLFKTDSFVESINALGEIKNIEVVKNGENRIIRIKFDEEKEVKVEIDKNNAIIGYSNNHVKRIKEFFLTFNTKLKYISLDNCEIIEQDFMDYNKALTELSFPKVRIIDKEFLNQNTSLVSVYLPELREISSYFLGANKTIKSLYVPKVRKIGSYVLVSNQSLTKLDLPEVEEIGYSFMCSNNNPDFEELYIPKLKKMQEYCFSCLRKIKGKIILPEIEEIGNHCFYNLEKVDDVYLPKVKRIGDEFLMYNDSLTSLILPNVEVIGEKFLKFNTKLKTLILPLVKKIKTGMLESNEVLEYFEVPKDAEIAYGYDQKIIHSIIDRLQGNVKKMI